MLRKAKRDGRTIVFRWMRIELTGWDFENPPAPKNLVAGDVIRALMEPTTLNKKKSILLYTSPKVEEDRHRNLINVRYSFKFV